MKSSRHFQMTINARIKILQDNLLKKEPLKTGRSKKVFGGAHIWQHTKCERESRR